MRLVSTLFLAASGVLLCLPGCTSSELPESSDEGPWEEARRSGVDFRAVGQEPGWYLTIAEGDSIVFAYDYAQRRVTTPAPVPTVDPAEGRTTYRAETEAHDLFVVLEDRPCEDVMSGEAFEMTVTVVLDETTYHGCGRALR